MPKRNKKSKIQFTIPNSFFNTPIYSLFSRIFTEKEHDIIQRSFRVHQYFSYNQAKNISYTDEIKDEIKTPYGKDQADQFIQKTQDYVEEG